MGKIKDYYSVLDDNSTLSELAKLNVSQEEFGSATELLKKTLWNFSRDVDTVDLIGKTILSMCDSLSDNPNAEMGFFNICEMFGGYKPNSDINTLKSYINEIFAEYEEQEYYIKRLPKTKEDVFNLSVPILAYALKEKSDLCLDFQNDDIEQQDENTGEELIQDEIEKIEDEKQDIEQEANEILECENDSDHINEVSKEQPNNAIEEQNDDITENPLPQKEGSDTDVEPIKGQEVIVMDENGCPTEINGVVSKIFYGILYEDDKYIEVSQDAPDAIRVAEVVVYDTWKSVFVPIQRLIFDFQEDDNLPDFCAPPLENKAKQNKVGQNNTSEYKLNGFLQFILIGSIIGTIIKTISECLNYSIEQYYVFYDIYPNAFYTASFIMAAIHIAGLLVISVKKSITGLYIIIGGFVCSLLMQMIMNNEFGFSMFDVEQYFINGIIRIPVLALLLLLRKNGLSAYDVFKIKKRESKKMSKKTKKTWIVAGSIITFAILLVILFFAVHDKDSNTKSSYVDNKKITLKELTFNGLTLSYPDNWSVEKKVIIGGYQVSLEKNGLNNSEYIGIIFLKGGISDNLSLDKWLQNTIMDMKSEYFLENYKSHSFNLLQFTSIYNSTFKDIECRSVDYTGTYFGESYCGKITVFIMNGNSVMIIKQSDTKEKLETEFMPIEKSINFAEKINFVEKIKIEARAIKE